MTTLTPGSALRSVMDPPPLVHLVDDNPAAARLLGAAGFSVRTYRSPLEFMATYDPDRPGCVVLEVAMPHLDGLSVQRLLHEQGGLHPVIFLSSGTHLPDVVRALKAGAVEFLGKPCDDAILLDAVRDALERDHRQRLARRRERLDRSRLGTLTEREHEVLGLVVSGRLNKQIAADVGISERTVKFHRANLMDKLGTGSLADLVRLATQMGLA